MKKRITTLLFIGLLVINLSMVNFKTVSAQVIPSNEPAAKVVNWANWREKGYTGKGVKIAVIDQGNFNTKLSIYNNMITKVDDPLFDVPGSCDLKHVQGTVGVINQIAPDAQIFLYSSGRNLKDIVEDCHSRGINIINFSATTSAFPEEIRALNKYCISDMLFVESAGNEGKSLQGLCLLPQIVKVGAGSTGVASLIRESYSSYGEELDTIGVTNLLVYNDNGDLMQFMGTSCAAPAVTGMMAQFYQYYNEKMGKFPNAYDARMYINNRSIDMEDIGFDIYTGYGYLKQPDIDIIEKQLTLANNHTENSVKMIDKQGQIVYVAHEIVKDDIILKGYRLTQ
ncbi:S8 family serine peptidase [Clostridium tagluense]|uniref:S8 family serine peptidase n=1 Tax=Clostridium tagluense TaxID=360422 RepID=UPI001C6E5896|nr:S8 family serine peptidase [Clostridium tagluense]MBW9157238.1 S8 family serine peptidase [Clostridium tagluense]WLC67162.1 S8 family serine peptidase [Clostridium tagluense]